MGSFTISRVTYGKSYLSLSAIGVTPNHIGVTHNIWPNSFYIIPDRVKGKSAGSKKRLASPVASVWQVKTGLPFSISYAK